VRKWVQRAGALTAMIAILAGAAGCSTIPAPMPVVWSYAPTHFAVGEAQSPMVYDRKDASRCVGRWRLHADAIDDGAFPAEAQDALPDLLDLRSAIGGAEFFTIDLMVPYLVREASDEAEDLLRKALKGDAQAFREYFEALGRCSSRAETVRDDGVGAVEEAAEG